MNYISEFQPSVPPNPFAEAIAKLERAGKRIALSDIPGLTLVDGQELTMGQVIDFARQLSA